MKQLWFPSGNLIAGLSHFAWGALVVLAFALFGHLWIGLGAMAAFAAIKEFVFDALVEGQTTKDNLTDFVEYAGGFVLALVLWFVSHKV